MGRRRGGAAEGRAAQPGVKGRGQENCRRDGSEEYRGEHHAHFRAGDCSGHFRRIRKRFNTECTEVPRSSQRKAAVLLHEKEWAYGEGIDSGAVEAADGAAGSGDEGLAKKIERGVDEDGGGTGFAEFVEEFPEER